MEHIFEPFWQGQKPDTGTAGGTGMGLSLARRLSEMLSGEPGGGGNHGPPLPPAGRTAPHLPLSLRTGRPHTDGMWPGS